jgi:hypothetical protein
MQTKRAETQTDRPIASAAMLTELADRARALASDLDAAATVITEENARNEEGARKYEQFRELMKNI